MDRATTSALEALAVSLVAVLFPASKFVRINSCGRLPRSNMGKKLDIAQWAWPPLS